MSVFVDVDPADWVASNELAFAIRDSFPVNRGHTLVITRRVVTQWWQATPAERSAIFELVDDVKRRLDSEYAPDGYNVGFNAGTAAGLADAIASGEIPMSQPIRDVRNSTSVS